MWLSQTDRWIVPVGSVISASLTIFVACSGLEGSPSHLMQPETVKFPELWFLRMVSTGVDVIGASGWNGNWMECGGASWITVPLFRNTMLLDATCRLESVTGCCVASFEEKVGAWKTLLFAPWLLPTEFCLLQLAGWCQSTDFWRIYFPVPLEHPECIQCNLLKRNSLLKK